jgi:hypothetical protein
VQAPGDGHETASRNENPVGLFVAWSDHLPRVQRSANVPPPVLVYPTAVQSVADGQDTLVSPELSAGLRVRCSVHRLPFQRSASAPLNPANPTAMQAVGDMQDTPVNQPNRPVPEAWIVQVVPFQRSDSVFRPSPVDPTAMQYVARGHDTADSSGLRPAGLGVDCRFHCRPFHRSASVLYAPERVWYAPTAVQAFRDEQDTPFRSEVTEGFGVGWIDQPAPALAPLVRKVMKAVARLAPRIDDITRSPLDRNLASITA